MSEQVSASTLAKRETRLSVAITATHELVADLDNVISRLAAMRHRILGDADDCPAPINQEVEPERHLLDSLDYQHQRISSGLAEAKRLIACLEEV